MVKTGSNPADINWFRSHTGKVLPCYYVTGFISFSFICLEKLYLKTTNIKYCGRNLSLQFTLGFADTYDPNIHKL